MKQQRRTPRGIKSSDVYYRATISALPMCNCVTSENVSMKDCKTVFQVHIVLIDLMRYGSHKVVFQAEVN